MPRFINTQLAQTDLYDGSVRSCQWYFDSCSRDIPPLSPVGLDETPWERVNTVLRLAFASLGHDLGLSESFIFRYFVAERIELITIKLLSVIFHDEEIWVNLNCEKTEQQKKCVMHYYSST